MEKTSSPGAALTVTVHFRPALLGAHPLDEAPIATIVGLPAEVAVPLTLCKRIEIDPVFGETNAGRRVVVDGLAVGTTMTNDMASAAFVPGLLAPGPAEAELDGTNEPVDPPPPPHALKNARATLLAKAIVPRTIVDRNIIGEPPP